MIMITRYACGICGEEYDAKSSARKCEARGLPKPSVSVGDIVLLGSGFGWFDGDPAWVSNLATLGRSGTPGRLPGCVQAHGNCFSERCTYRFYYVVAAVDHDQHRVRYHVRTKAMTGRQGYAEGWTFDSGHIKPRLARDPPRCVVESSNDLVGQLATHLL